MEQTVSERQGLVFDIQRGSLRDGPGLRTTIYLKGCPLHCVWCRNPEGGSSQPEISFSAGRCTGCHSCAEICPEHVHHFDQPYSHLLERDFCRACAQCVSKCPAEALRRVGEWMDVDQVVSAVDAERDYFTHTHGAGRFAGVSLSGGEPMLQFPFTRSLLSEFHQRGLHTCLETCGYAARARYEQILPLVDLFLYDYKATNPNDHALLTGASNRAILSNLNFLLDSGAKVLLRCPLVPGINDTPEHMAGIAAMSRRYPQLVGIEILPYQDGGATKANQVGRHPLLEGVQMPSEEKKNAWVENLQALGCERVRLC